MSPSDQSEPLNAESEKRNPVVIYTHTLLAGSMTFIRSHGEALRMYEALYVGAHRASNGLAVPQDRSWVVNPGSLSGKASEYLFRRFRVWPRRLEEMARRKPVLVHAHFGPSGPSGLTIARRLGVPLIVTFHGNDATVTREATKTSWRGRAYIRALDELIDECPCVIAVSDFIRQRVLAQGFPPERVITQYNGIDTGYFLPSPLMREPVILFVGRFVEKKGVEFLIEALRILRNRGINSKTVLIGDGPLRSKFEQQVQSSGVEVKFTGFLPLAEVRRWLNRATVVVVPSVTARNGDSEGLPTIVLEAQAMATPVVATRHSGIPEGLLDGETAFLVEERDAESLADRMLILLKDTDMARKFGEAGRAFVESHFSLPCQVRKLEAIYSRTVGHVHQ